MQNRSAIAALLAACLLIVPAAAQDQDKPATQQERAQQQALAFVRLMTGEKFEQASAYFGGKMAEVMDAEKLEAIWDSLERKYGEFERFGPPNTVQGDPYFNVIFEGVWAQDRLRIRVVIDDGGWVAGMWFEPAAPPPYEPPNYVKTKRFTEKDVTIGQEPWALPGTITLPQGKSNLPGVVLVHGSGPNDRDELVGGCRPFRDLAWGLATQKIAVLRYDKRTYAHRQQTIDSPDQDSLDAEVIDDALAAVALLRSRPETDPQRIFVLGHSLGGMCAPEIAKRDGKLAGVILMAAPARDTETLITEQLAFQASLLGGKPDEQPEYKETMARLQAVVAHEVDDDEPVLGARGRYWHDLMQRDGQAAVQQAQALNCPLLVLQGGKDCQVTAKDFDIWKSALADRPNATFKLFDDLNHLFAPCEGRSTGAEYMQPGHVDRQVIQTIANWIRGK